ncbi:MAG: ABC transporter substrate-binding protein [Fibrobacter sp.]|nr:ABC transporter substrate-binding protein [Fibrobacter sp.]
MKKKYILRILIILLVCGIVYLFFSRLNLPAEVPPTSAENCTEVPDKTLLYAENFGVNRCGDFRVVWVKNGAAEPLRWVLKDSLSPERVPENLLAYPTVKIPGQRIAIFSSTYLGFLTVLGVEDRVAVIDAKKYIANPEFYARVDSLHIREVGEGMELSPEAVYESQTDMIFAFSMGASIHDVFPKLARLKMPVVLTSEWTENTPLAKAEWLKFFGIFVGKEALADSIFEEKAKRYKEVREKIDSLLQSEKRPVVMTGTPSSGTWFASPGRSFMAHLIHDAGGRYLWESDTSLASFSMPFEKAFADGQKADVWMNPGAATTLAELLDRDPRVERLPLWKTGEIYEYDLRKGPEGGIDFYESAVVKPDSLLLDVAKMLHPTYFKSIVSKWYRKLSNI